MSEQILERPTSVGEPGATLAGFDEPPPKSGRKRTYLVISLAVLAGLILGMILLFVMRGRAAAQAEAVAAAEAAQAAARAEAAAAAAVRQAEDVVVPATRTRVRITSRDPFTPLIPEPPPAPPAPQPTGPSGDQTSVPGSSSSAGSTISALSISARGDSVTLKLDGKRYEVDVGETFAKSYRLYSIFDDSCAGFLYGDQNAVVCQGGSVTLG